MCIGKRSCLRTYLKSGFQRTEEQNKPFPCIVSELHILKRATEDCLACEVRGGLTWNNSKTTLRLFHGYHTPCRDILELTIARIDWGLFQQAGGGSTADFSHCPAPGPKECEAWSLSVECERLVIDNVFSKKVDVGMVYLTSRLAQI